MKYIYNSKRYYRDKVEEYDTLEEAKLAARVDSEFGEAYFINITDDKGNIIFDEDNRDFLFEKL